MKKTTAELRKILFIIPLVLVLVLGMYRSLKAPLSDYAGYYFGSGQLLKGNYHQVYNTDQFNTLIQQKGYEGIFVSFTPFTPFTALVYAPFLLTSPEISKLIFNILAGILFLAAIYRIKNFLRLPSFFYLWAALLYVPIQNNILFGQAYLLLFALLSEGFIAWQKNRLLQSSLLWGTAIVFKVFPVFIVVYLLIKKQFRAAGYLVTACCVLMALSAAFSGMDAWMFYISLMPRLNSGELNDSFTWVFQSFYMLAKKAFLSDALLNPRPVWESAYAFVLIVSVLKATVIAVAIGFTSKTWNAITGFSMWIFASMLLSPNGSTYSLILLLFPLILLYSTKTARLHQLILPALIVVAANIPLAWFADMPLLFQFPRLYLLLLLFFLLCYVYRVKLSLKLWAVTGLLLVLSELPRFLHQERDDSACLLTKEEHILINGLYVTQNKLAYTYRSKEGVFHVVTGFTVRQYKKLLVDNNQLVVDGTIITHTSDWKKDPLLVNNEYIVYLSDRNRGIGFYTIRQMKIR